MVIYIQVRLELRHEKKGDEPNNLSSWFHLSATELDVMKEFGKEQVQKLNARTHWSSKPRRTS